MLWVQCDEIPEWKKDECPNSKPEGHYFICKEDIETRKRRR